jgi:hypothetical protein
MTGSRIETDSTWLPKKPVGPIGWPCATAPPYPAAALAAVLEGAVARETIR